MEDVKEKGFDRFHYVCTTKGTDLQLRESVNDLYKTINSSRTDVRLDYRVKELFSTVLNSRDNSSED